ncbi:MAG: hypothetical protein ACLSHU_12490 [Oscillospiraceae bacterium]
MAAAKGFAWGRELPSSAYPPWRPWRGAGSWGG